MRFTGSQTCQATHHTLTHPTLTRRTHTESKLFVHKTLQAINRQGVRANPRGQGNPEIEEACQSWRRKQKLADLVSRELALQMPAQKPECTAYGRLTQHLSPQPFNLCTGRQSSLLLPSNFPVEEGSREGIPMPLSVPVLNQRMTPETTRANVERLREEFRKARMLACPRRGTCRSPIS
jgi:hypothetical protein